MRKELSIFLLSYIFAKLNRQLKKEENAIFEEAVNILFLTHTGELTFTHDLGDLTRITKGSRVISYEMPESLHERWKYFLTFRNKRNSDRKEIKGYLRRALLLGDNETDWMNLMPEILKKRVEEVIGISSKLPTISNQRISEFMEEEEHALNRISYCLMKNLIQFNGT